MAASRTVPSSVISAAWVSCSSWHLASASHQQEHANIHFLLSCRSVTPWKFPSWMDMLQKKDKKTECDDQDFRKQLLSYIKEMPFIGLFDDVRATTK